MIKKGGIIRNRFKQLKDIKDEKERKKHRFQQALFKDEEEQITPNETPNKGLIPAGTPSSSLNVLNTTASSSSSEQKESSDYTEAKQILKAIGQIQKKIKTLTVSRFTSFKQSEVKSFQHKIDELSSEAMQKLVKAQRILGKIRNSQSDNPIQQQIVRNLERSLAAQIRQATKNLRQQQRQYYERLKSYEKHSTNHIIQMAPALNHDYDDDRMDQEMLEQEVDKQKNEQVDKLCQSIAKLSSIYKEMNQLVIDQGSIVDRIDYNIEATLQHTKKAVVHLQGAEEAASSPFADRVIRSLITMIIVLAVVMGYKFSSHK